MQTMYAGIMDRASFDKELCACVKRLLSDGDGIELSQTKKNNGVLKEVLYIRNEGRECVPCFYMDELYQSYCMGEAIVGLAEYMVNIVKGESEKVREQMKWFKCKDWVRQNLFLRLIHREKNREILEDSICFGYMDLVGVVYVATEISDDGVKCFRLPKHMWESLELGESDTCFPLLIENTRRLFPEKLEYIQPMVKNEESVRGELPDFLKNVNEEEKFVANRLYVLSNQRRINGATVILYPQLLQTIGERFGGGYYIIPSSIHEVIVFKDDIGGNLEKEEGLNEMIREVNQTVVVPEDVLSDHVYYYSVSDQKLEYR